MKEFVTLDANEAVAKVAHKLNEVVAIYPITPASPMGEWADAWSSQNKPNVWGFIPRVIEMQSEGGAAGTVHGSLQNGALTTTFTASQGLLLMIPNMFKIAGELTPTVFHVAARSIATHALSIFGDHSDVMSARGTGWGLLASSSVQEAHDLAAIAHAATLTSRIPIVHFFDGFRTSHEVQKIELLNDEQLLAMIDEDAIDEFRKRSLTPDAPTLRGTAQNPDVFFQAREAANSFYEDFTDHLMATMEAFREQTGRAYKPYDYFGHPEAENVIVVMGSGAETVQTTVEYLASKGEKVGVVVVRMFRPFAAEHFVAAFPLSTKKIAVLDRTKEPGASGEPMYQDVITSFAEALSEPELHWQTMPKIVGGRYGLSSKEFTPAMVEGIFTELKKDQPKNHFTIGINDDVTHTSLDYNIGVDIEPEGTFRAMFFGLGSDGTVSANKNTIKIIGENTDNFAQGYFVYDSKKSGSVTTSHLRFGKKPIRAPYLIEKAEFVACHQFEFIKRYDMLKYVQEGGVFLLNSPYSATEVWDKLPKMVQEKILEKKLNFYVIDAEKVASEAGMGRRINTVMQTAFFAVSGVLPRDEAIAEIKKAIKKTYGKRGETIVQQNFEAVDSTVDHLERVDIDLEISSEITMRPVIWGEAPVFVENVLSTIIEGRGDELPVSSMPVDGTFPTGTSQYEKRCIASTVPVLDPDVCIQCGKCAIVCPHGVIRMKAYDGTLLEEAPNVFKAMKAKGREFPDGTMVSVQVSPEDCTGCELCVEACPAKNRKNTSLKALNMAPIDDVLEDEKKAWDFFVDLPDIDRSYLKLDSVRGSQFLQPLFEFSGACSGCGETPYIKLLSQLFGDRMLVANATGCSSIYGGNLPTTPWSKNKDGRGPAWSNSLFEDNAEFGLGYRIAVDMKSDLARDILERMKSQVGEELVAKLLENPQSDDAEIETQRKLIVELNEKLKGLDTSDARRLSPITDFLVKKSVWILGGDGWAYDIGYGGLDHVLSSGRNVNVMVLDTEVYSNTGGQMSKATPKGAVAKFAAGGKTSTKKDLALQAVNYGNVYVGRIAMGANDMHTLKTIIEAEKFDGPSIIIAYSHCIAHGYDMKYGMSQQKKAVESGHWPLFRFNPALEDEGKNPFMLDSKKPKIPLADYVLAETRYKILEKLNPKESRRLLAEAQKEVDHRWHLYEGKVKEYEPEKEEN